MTDKDLHQAYKSSTGIYPPPHILGDSSDRFQKAYIKWLEELLLKTFNLVDMVSVDNTDIKDLIDYINKHGK